MEISENQLCHFVLSDIVHKCFENKMMFASWFDGYNVIVWKL